MNGYKIFDHDWSCRGFQYELGRVYKLNATEILEVCRTGFHFCSELKDCFNYRSFFGDVQIAEIEAIGNILVMDDLGHKKYVTDEIRIIRDTHWSDVLKSINTGYGNLGIGNTGDFNTGSGNAGDYNMGDYNTGLFCTKVGTLKFFDVDSDITMADWIDTQACRILLKLYQYYDNTTQNRGDGAVVHKDMWKKWWLALNQNEKQEIMGIPNFDKKKFEEITGILIKS